MVDLQTKAYSGQRISRATDVFSELFVFLTRGRDVVLIRLLALLRARALPLAAQ